jgi:hypothetical protein
MRFGGGPMMSVALKVDGHDVVLTNVRLTSPRSPSRIDENRRLTLELVTSLKSERRPTIMIGAATSRSTAGRCRRCATWGYTPQTTTRARASDGHGRPFEMGRPSHGSTTRFSRTTSR